jgi:hypothetical protein
LTLGYQRPADAEGLSAYEQAELDDYEILFGPLGLERLDALFGWLILNLRRVMGDSKVTMRDCLPQWGSGRPRFDAEADEAALAAISRADIPEWARDDEEEEPA